MISITHQGSGLVEVIQVNVSSRLANMSFPLIARGEVFITYIAKI